MLNPEDRRAIEGLFDRLGNVERTAEPRDRDAENLIKDKIASQPAAPYYMAQTILVQESALNLAEQRIRELEDKLSRQPQTDFFGGLFGGGRDRQRSRDIEPTQRQPQPQADRSGPWDNNDRRGAGGGFLAGAAQTALGVTSGVLLGSAIAGMFGAGAAQAAEPAPEDNNADNDTGNDGNDGGDFDTGGGFDGGGDFGGGDFGGGDF